jgi:hypothetical protein
MDAERRESERLGRTDPDAAFAAGVAARRAGDTASALAWFERACWAGRPEAGDEVIRLVEGVPVADRVRHVPRLDLLEEAGCGAAGALWRRWFPALARIEGPASVTRPIRDFVCRNASRMTPVRLAGMCDASQEIVARALHALSGRRIFHAQREFVAPTEQLHGVEYVYANRPFDTFLLYGQSESHYGRILERLLALCADRNVRVVLGIRRDSCEGDRFPPFEHGEEFEVPTLTTGPLADDEVPRFLLELLRGSGWDDGPLPGEVVRLLGGVSWTARGLCSVARHWFLDWDPTRGAADKLASSVAHRRVGDTSL